MADKKDGTSEAAIGWGLLAFVFAGLAYLIWYNFKIEIQSGIRWIRYAEMWVTSWFVGDDYTVTWRGQDINFDQLMAVAKRIPAERIDGQFLSLLSTAALSPLLPLISLVICIISFWALFRGPGSEHRQKFSIDTLIKKQANIFPIISPFITFNPSKQPPRAPGSPVPIDLPSFAEALSPEEWIVYNEIPVQDKKLDGEATHKAFARQLGPRWRGYKHLANYKQVLLAAFCLKAARRRADADAMLGRLAKSWTFKGGLRIDGKLMREAQAVLRNQDISGKVLRKCNEHAWETTAMMRALVTAREEGGVLAPAQFVWLRAHDRALWYPLNNMGRQSFHIEAMGAMAHYKAEKLAQRPIPRPKMHDPVKVIADYINSPAARALPKIDYGKTNRGIKKVKTA